ncbi:pickpocket protein 28 isoform X3 [Armigeres subalbatus]|uniref:pickpocket protein 28 isoform X3 n=1 Tax=Armigeres subalbatus TaxID=124917 RepID=UPI002ED24B32
MRISNERLFHKSYHGLSPKLIQFNQNKAPKVTFAENFQEYCLNTTLHGLKYIGTTSISVVERCFFFISFVLVSILSIYFITNVYQKWQASPIIIGFSPTSTHIRDIPFPAVTICNMNQATRKAAEAIKPNTQDKAILDSICSLDGEFNLTDFEGKWSTVRNMLLSITQPCHNLIRACRYAQNVYNCEHIFRPVLTDEGLCCTFNSVNLSWLLINKDTTAMQVDLPDNPFVPIQWTPETGFIGKQTNSTFPRSVAGTGANMGLSVVLDANVKDYYCSSTSSYGFKLLLHNPTETPKMAEYAHYIQVGTENRIIVSPRISDASFLIRKTSIAQRQCIFASESKLSYFRTYSQNNCEMECEARLVAESCGCVLYYMPKLEDSKICSKADSGCYEEIRSSIALTSNTTFNCRCLPGCFEINYESDRSSADLNVGDFKVRDHLVNTDGTYASENIALVYIFFSDMFFRRYTKGELIGFTDFLSNIGGLLGLFMGFSLISLAEVIYFMTLRPLFAKRREIQDHIKQDSVFRERHFNTVYNNVFNIQQKAAHNRHVHFAGDTVNGTEEEQIVGWMDGAFRLRRKTNGPKQISTIPFYE